MMHKRSKLKVRVAEQRKKNENATYNLFSSFRWWLQGLQSYPSAIKICKKITSTIVNMSPEDVFKNSSSEKGHKIFRKRPTTTSFLVKLQSACL